MTTGIKWRTISTDHYVEIKIEEEMSTVETKNYGKIFGDFMNDPGAFSGKITECDAWEVLDEIKRLKDATLDIQDGPTYCEARLYYTGHQIGKNDQTIAAGTTFAKAEGHDRFKVLLELCDRAITVI